MYKRTTRSQSKLEKQMEENKDIIENILSKEDDDILPAVSQIDLTKLPPVETDEEMRMAYLASEHESLNRYRDEKRKAEDLPPKPVKTRRITKGVGTSADKPISKLQLSQESEKIVENLKKQVMAEAAERIKRNELTKEQAEDLVRVAEFSIRLKMQLEELGISYSTEDINLAYELYATQPNSSIENMVFYVKGIHKGSILSLKDHEKEYGRLNNAYSTNLKEQRYLVKKIEDYSMNLATLMSMAQGRIPKIPTSTSHMQSEVPVSNINANLKKQLSKSEGKKEMKDPAESDPANLQMVLPGSSVEALKKSPIAGIAEEDLNQLQDYCNVLRTSAERIISMNNDILNAEEILTIMETSEKSRWVEASTNLKAMKILRNEVYKNLAEHVERKKVAGIAGIVSKDDIK